MSIVFLNTMIDFGFQHNHGLKAWLIMISLVLIMLICVYYARKMSDSDVFGTEAIDKYFEQLRQKTWEIAMENMHQERNQAKAKIVKTDDKAKKAKQAYMYSYDFLKRDIARNLGIYGHVPDYVKIWAETQTDKKLNLQDKNQVLLAFDKWLDPDCRIYYLYFDIKQNKYVYSDMVQAASDMTIPMKKELKRKVLAGEMLSLHFMPVEKLTVEWSRIGRRKYLGIIKLNPTNYIKLLITSRANETTLLGVQFYNSEKALKAAKNGEDLLTLKEMYQQILQHMSETPIVKMVDAEQKKLDKLAEK